MQTLTITQDKYNELAPWLEWHLTRNHYPPIHRMFIPVARAALTAAREGDTDQPIPLPNGNVLTADEIIAGLHLESFLS